MLAKSLQSCPTLCTLMDCSPPGSSVHEILQARILEWVSMPSSKGSSQPRDRTWVSDVFCISRRLFFFYYLRLQRSPKYAHTCVLTSQSCPTLVTPWTVAHQAPLWDSPGENTGVGCHSLLQNTHVGTVKCKHLDIFYMDILHRDLEYLRALGYVSRTW